MAVGFIIDPGLWRAWFDTLLNADATYELGHPLGPLPFRLALGAAVTALRRVERTSVARADRHADRRARPMGLQPRAPGRRPAPDPPIDEVSATDEESSRFRVRPIAESIGASWLMMAALILVRANEVAIPLDFILRPLVVAIIPSILIGLLASSLGQLRIPAAAGLSILAFTPALWPAIVAIGAVELGIWWLQRRTGGCERYAVGSFTLVAILLVAIDQHGQARPLCDGLSVDGLGKRGLEWSTDLPGARGRLSTARFTGAARDRQHGLCRGAGGARFRPLSDGNLEPPMDASDAAGAHGWRP